MNNVIDSRNTDGDVHSREIKQKYIKVFTKRLYIKLHKFHSSKYIPIMSVFICLVFRKIMYLAVFLAFFCLMTVEGSVPTVSLPHYGAIFTSRGFYNNHFAYWSHTYAIPLPDLAIPDETPNVTCDNYNIKHFCETYKTVFKFATSQINQYKARIAQHQRTIISLTSSSAQTRRNKRGLFDFIGEIGKSLFGLSTIHDARVLAKHVEEIEEVLNNINGNAMFKVKYVNSFMVDANKRFENIAHAISQNNAAIQNVTSSLNFFLRSSYQQFHTQEALRDYVNDYVLFMSAVLQQLQVQIPILLEVEKEAQSFINDLQLLHTGVLSTNLVPTTILSQLINNISDALMHTHPDLQVAYSDISKYYKMSKIHAIAKNNILYLHLQIPLKSFDSLFKLYHTQTYPIPVRQHHVNVTRQNAMTVIEDVSRYIAISENNDFYIELSDSDLMSCTGNEFLECSKPKSLVRSTYPSCTSALFFNNTDQVLDLCNILYSDDISIEPVMVYLDKGEILIISDPMDLTLSCFAKPPRIISHSGFSKIKIPCGCTITSKYLLIPTSHNNCQYSDSIISHVLPTNILYLNVIMPQIGSIPIETNHTSPIVFNVSQIHLTTANLSDFALKDQRFAADLKKTVAIMNQDKIPFIKPSDKLFDLASDLSLSSLTPTASLPFLITLVNLSLNFILFLFSLYLIYKYKLISAIVFSARGITVDAAPTLTDFQLELTQFEHHTLYVIVPFCLLLGALFILIIYLAYHCIGKYCSVAYYFNFKSKTNILLDIASPKCHISFKVASIPVPPGYVRIHSRDEIQIVHVSQTLFGGKVFITWNDLTLEIYHHERSIPLPTYIKINPFQVRALQNILKTPYTVRLLAGDAHYYTNIPLAPAAIVPNDHIYLTPNPPGHVY